MEKAEPSVRFREPSKRLFAFGLVGRLVYGASSGSVPTLQYHLLNAAGEMLTLLSDESWPVGSCVEIRLEKDTGVGPRYAYGAARLLASAQCPAYGLAAAK